jgi:hypothetical protein
MRLLKGGDMVSRRVSLRPAALILASLACSLSPQATPTATSTASPSPAPPTATATLAPPTATPLPSGSGPCRANSAGGVTTFTRPSFLAEVFSEVGLPPDTEITSRSPDGWLGFNPGVAQAANIGVFRQRWLPPDAVITLAGDCVSVPVEPWVPEPGVCYQMSMGPVEVHASADPASAVSHTLMVGEFVAILGRTPTGWLFVNGDQANTPGVVGFIPELEMNANGPCDAIPTV